jgi:hypothetical protein
MVNLPHRKIVESTMARFAPETLFIVYRNEPHCNGADRLRISRLGRRVKKMIGGGRLEG